MTKLEYNSLDELIDIVEDELFKAYGDDGVNALDFIPSPSIALRKFQEASVSDESFYRFIYFSIAKGYDWLFNSRIKGFKYNNITYNTFLNFIFHLEIVIHKLVNDISDLEGDIDRAILLNECNPGFNSRVKFMYNGELITSIDYVAKKYRVNRAIIVSLIRDGYDPEEAVDMARELSKVQDTKMALTEKGYKTLTEFREYHGMSHDNFYTMVKTYKLTPSEIIITIEDLYFEIYGEECLTVNSLAKLTGLHVNTLNSILYEAFLLPNTALRNKQIETKVDDLRRKLTYDNHQYSSISDMSRGLGLKRESLDKLKNRDLTVAEFTENIYRLLLKK